MRKSHLGSLGKAKLKQLKQELPQLNQLQSDLLDLLVVEWETLQSVETELQKHIDATGSMMHPGSQGQLAPHPAFKIKQQAMGHYLKLAQQLRISLQSGTEQAPSTDEIDAIFK